MRYASRAPCLVLNGTNRDVFVTNGGYVKRITLRSQDLTSRDLMTRMAQY